MGDEGGGAQNRARIQKDGLPGDIVRDIQSRLPVKALLRFTCVCKTWYKYIKEEDPLLKNSKKKERLTLTTCYYDSWKSGRKPMILTLSVDPPAPTVRRVVNAVPFRWEPNSTGQMLGVRGPCNGIFCLYCYKEHKITLWNPATREIKAVPDPSYIGKYLRGYGRAVAEIGFGFDSRNNDYKVVKIWHLRGCSPGNNCLKFFNEVEVYSLNTDSWRITKAVLPILVDAPPHSSAYLNEIHYWWYNRDKILSFSMADEIFEMIPRPPVAFSYSMRLVVWKHHLALVNNCFLSLYDIWILTEKEKGEKTWIRGDTIGPLMYHSFFVGIGVDDVLILEDDKGILFCNYRTRETTRLQTSDLYHCHTSVFPYTESLVSIKGEPEPTGINELMVPLM